MAAFQFASTQLQKNTHTCKEDLSPVCREHSQGLPDTLQVKVVGHLVGHSTSHRSTRWRRWKSYKDRNFKQTCGTKTERNKMGLL